MKSSIAELKKSLEEWAANPWVALVIAAVAFTMLVVLSQIKPSVGKLVAEGSSSKFTLSRQEVVLLHSGASIFNALLVIFFYFAGANITRQRREATAWMFKGSQQDPSEVGYALVRVPENQKQSFKDILQGFEEYARLRGYKVRMSIVDHSVDTLAVRFEIEARERQPREDDVREDFKEYVDRASSDRGFDDLETRIPLAEHLHAVMAVQNRLNMIEHNCRGQQNLLALYEKLLDRMSNAFAPTQIFQIQGGQAVSRDSYNVVNSPQSAVGTGNVSASNSLLNRGDEAADAEPFELLSRFLALLKQDSSTDERRTKLIQILEVIREELQDQPKPDQGLVRKLVDRAKTYLPVLSQSVDLATKAQQLFSVLSGHPPV